jgi:hypothetical protein
MNFLFGTLLLFISIGLLYLLISLLKKNAGSAFQMLSSEISSENGEPLIRALPLNPNEIEKIVCSDMQISQEMYGRFKVICNELLAKMLICGDAPQAETNGAYQVLLMDKLMDNAKDLTPIAGHSKEILISRFFDREEKVSDNIKLYENLIPVELYEILWSSLVISKSQEFLEEISKYIDSQSVETISSEWLNDEDLERIAGGFSSVRELLRSVRKNMFMSEAVRRIPILEDIYSETHDMLKNITAATVTIKDKSVISNRDKENDTVKVVNQHEEALNAYLNAVGIRTLAAVVGMFIPAAYKKSRQHLEECKRILEDVRGQITVLLRAMDSVDADEFFSMSKDGKADKEQIFFSLAYPSYLLYELLTWYKKHMVTESIGLIQAKVQPKFWQHENRINELLKVVNDAFLYTDNPIKGDVSFLMLTDKSGAVIDIKWIVRFK